jgi:hypothetical protein
MVESALEFLAVCEDEGFRSVVFSMKSSNAQVAIQAYRLLAARLAERAPGAPSYPVHLGVTEAGDGLDGRIKSAIGIGALLEDGIGDTIRVSLTEDPVKEVPVARALAARYEARFAKPPEGVAPGGAATSAPRAPFSPDPFAHARRATRTLGAYAYTIGADQPVRVELDLGPVPADPAGAARELAEALGRAPEIACEGVLLDVAGARDAERVEAFGTALKEMGVTAPLALRAALADGAPAARAARLVARIRAADAAALAAFALSTPRSRPRTRPASRCRCSRSTVRCRSRARACSPPRSPSAAEATSRSRSATAAIRSSPPTRRSSMPPPTSARRSATGSATSCRSAASARRTARSPSPTASSRARGSARRGRSSSRARAAAERSSTWKRPPPASRSAPLTSRA